MSRTNHNDQMLAALRRAAEQQAVPSEPASHRLGKPRPGCERLLLVDDDAAVLEITGALLSEVGYDVATAASGEAALGLLSTSKRYNVLITDYAMPGITGLDLVTNARRMCPLMPAVIVTGFAGNLLGQQLPPAVVILGKPFDVSELVRTMEQAATMMRNTSGGRYASGPIRHSVAGADTRQSPHFG